MPKIREGRIHRTPTPLLMVLIGVYVAVIAMCIAALLGVVPGLPDGMAARGLVLLVAVVFLIDAVSSWRELARRRSRNRRP